MKRKLFLLLCALLTMIGVTQVKAQASFNHTYTEGATVAAGGDYFLYNIESGTFLTGGMDWGSHATGDHAGKLVELQSEGGAYYLYTNYASANGVDNPGYLTAGDVYADNGGAEKAAYTFTSVEVDGYTNAYTLTTGGKYLFYDATNTKVNLRDEDSDNYSKWLLIPKSARDAVGDYTYYLQNVGINRFWERACWAGCTWGNDKVFATGGNADNPCGEKYHGALDFYQQITAGVPNGLYKLYCQGFWRQDGTDAAPVLYANNDTKEFSPRTGTENSMAEASTSFSAGNYVNSMETVVTDGSLRVGINITSGSQWVIFDNFTLDYIGTCLVNDAVALPDGGAMTAGTWYYFDIPAAGDDYNATATTLDNIICTADGKQLTSTATGEITLKATDNSFAKARYYVKSSSDNTLVVAAASYSYSVSEATADKAYIQPSNTVTVNFAVSTNDPSATLTQDYSGVTFDGVAINVTPGASGFTFTVPANLEAGVAHTLYIPADAIGYAAGSTFNAEQNIELNAAALYDGVYYMRNTYFNTYISRAGNYNTQAIQDKWGLAFKVSTDANNNTKLQYFDSELWLGDDGFCYGDCSGGRVRSFNVTKVANGYKFLNTNNNLYLAVYDGQTVGDAEEGVNLVGTSNVWDLESTEAHVANYTANDNAQAAAAATAAGIEGITTKAALAAELAANYGETEINITGAKAEKYQVYPGNGKDDGPVTYHSETVENLKPGLYKLSVAAFQRASTNDRVFAAGGARGLIYLYAGDAKTQLMSVSEYGSATKYADTDYEYDGKYYPNREQSAYDALATGNFNNEVYVYVADAGSGTGSLEIGIKNASRPGNNCQTWSVYNTWKLTYYEAKATPAEKAALADAIAAAEAKTPGFEEGEYAPYNNKEAFAALAAAKAINPETASGEAVVNATTALAGATWNANAEQLNAVYNGNFALSENDGAQVGWQTDHSAGLGGAYHARAFVLTSGMTNYDNLAAFGQGDATRSCSYFRFDGTNSSRTTKYTYGATAGYTMPLKTGTIYKLTAQAGGWGQTDKNFQVTIASSTNENVVAQNLKTPKTGVHAGGPVIDYEMYFVVPAAGDYKLVLNNPDNVDNAIVISNIVLKSTDALAFADDATFAYAPGTYPAASYERNVANTNVYGTICLPFNVESNSYIQFYTVEEVDGTNKVLKLETTDAVAAGVPAIYKNLTANATKIEVATNNATVVAAAGTQGTDPKLVGTFTGETVSGANVGKCYYLKGNQFWQGNENFTIPAYRAYIQTDVNEARLTISTDDDPTAINELKKLDEQQGLKDGKYLIGNKVIVVKAGKQFYINGALNK